MYPIYTEKTIQRALALYFDYQKQVVCVPNIFLFGWAMDCCCVTPSGVVVEVEIKTSMADWNNDQAKAKWQHPNRAKVGRFYYAVPHFLAHKVPAWVPEEYGILSVMTDDSGKLTSIYGEVRPAKLLSAYRATDKVVRELYRGAHFRYWQKATGTCVCQPLQLIAIDDGEENEPSSGTTDTSEL
jgi:hypothetical protein